MLSLINPSDPRFNVYHHISSETTMASA
uniref:Uncharacterized protein n=1 Tax=Arundo donax TaxID=35708 RepID=A0A0A9DX43_ARUDO